MPTSRMEAFSDGVIAILITVMVLELRVPHGTTWGALHESVPTLLTYVLSFVYLGIYWNNHHHMLMLTERIGGLVLWANLHLLFWLSLVPFATGWMGENHFAKVPASAYGIVLLGAALAYYALQTTIVRVQGPDSRLATAIGRDLKGKASPVLYITGIALAFANRWLAIAVYVIVALMWLIPDRRLERTIAAVERPSAG
ncbi:MAG TPA: TMEM175 family protein [Mycobacteriales bacterium]|nr:TMEM175 family protein [Mycobacteriales bacterium]